MKERCLASSAKEGCGLTLSKCLNVEVGQSSFGLPSEGSEPIVRLLAAVSSPPPPPQRPAETVGSLCVANGTHTTLAHSVFALFATRVAATVNDRILIV